jgi:hypothetical protein
VDVGSAVSIRFRAPDDLPGDGCDLSHAEEQEAQQVCRGTAFGPFEVHVWQALSVVSQAEQQAASAFGTLELLNVRTR